MQPLKLSCLVLFTLILITGCANSPTTVRSSFSVTPAIASVGTNASATFTASNTSPVTWSIQEGAAGGTISASGVYTAPSVTGVYHIVATSNADPSFTATATVTVISSCTGTCTPPSISLNTQGAGLKPGASVTFSATVHNLSDGTVAWTIQEASSGGTITDAGVYTAPLTEGVYHVTATSKANSSLSSTIPIVVTATEFSLTDNLSTARWGNTASLLQNGQVFIAGGVSAPGSNAVPAELYDPASGTFHSSSVQVSRLRHTATVLANGDVLLAGGSDFSSADLFKAGTGVIQPTGSMSAQRYGHTATLLQDGRVLLAGGAYDDWSTYSSIPIQSAELYDPASGKFTPTGDMSATRRGHSAALLPNGRVLIVSGGGGGYGGAAGGEIYDPATQTFVPVPGVDTNKCSASATSLADGRVLIAGGTICSYSYTMLDTAEIYDPATGQSTPTGKLVAPQAGHTTTLLPDGRVLLVGGNPGNMGQFYNPATGSFTMGPHLFTRDQVTQPHFCRTAASWSSAAATPPRSTSNSSHPRRHYTFAPPVRNPRAGGVLLRRTS
jgi:hypothetical protein